MKRTTLICALAAMMLAAVPASDAQAQKKNPAPTGVVVYALPSTTISITVEAEKEEFTAGPYARYAQKYMGTAARDESGTSYSLKSINLAPYLEADPQTRYTLNLSGREVAAANFLQFCSQGLVVTSDSYTGKPSSWRFASIADNDLFIGRELEGNLTNATTTLYKNVKTENGFQRVSVSQNQIVEKSLESKARETAEAIFRLRQSRMQIITGDTDATYSGEAMGAALRQIDQLEADYMSLFYGISVKSTQSMTFDVVPKAGEKQMYVAFRISDTAGLLAANNVSGRPVVLELALETPLEGSDVAVDPKRLADGSTVYYRVPQTYTARLLDGQTLLLQTRIPVYQLGQMRSFPLNLMTK